MDQSKNDKIKTLYAQITVLFEARKFRRALDVIAEGLALSPDDLYLRLRQCVVWRKVGQRAKSLSQLRALNARFPDHRAVACELATGLRLAGDLEGSLDLVQAIITADPSHMRARLEQVEALSALKRHGDALGAADVALALRSGHLGISLARAAVLGALGQSAEALSFLRELHAARPRNAQIALAFGDALLLAGDAVAADYAYEVVLNTAPRNIPAWLGRINCAVAQEAGEAALAHCEAARLLHPTTRAFIMRQTTVFLMLDRLQSGVAVLQEALDHAPDDAVLRSRLAQFYFLTGAPDAANAVFANAPEGYIATRSDVQRRADAAEAQGDAAGALQILGEAIGKGATPAPADMPAGLALKYCEMAVQTGQTDAVPQILLEIIAVIDTLHDVNLIRLVKLGERAEQLDVALAAINEIAARDRIRPFVAQFLVRRAHMVMDSAGSARLA
ncbi:MAG: tetratricopeptide repeat protein, partial [Sulfitobacter sp.]